MPKVFTRLCHNPLHYAWTGDTTEKNIISLRANGLGKVINVFRAIEVERGERRKNITNCCSLCLTYCCEKGILKSPYNSSHFFLSFANNWPSSLPRPL